MMAGKSRTCPPDGRRGGDFEDERDAVIDVVASICSPYKGNLLLSYLNNLSIF
jgi:hypothetical protein